MKELAESFAREYVAKHGPSRFANTDEILRMWAVVELESFMMFFESYVDAERLAHRELKASLSINNVEIEEDLDEVPEYA